MPPTVTGPDGRGLPTSVVGFDVPLPDFTDCSFATPEGDADWLAVAHSGGPARAFDDRMMPAFGEALNEDEILRTIAHIRTFCRSPGWPRGELNLPRPLVTEKAFPENEAVMTMTIDPDAQASVNTRFLYERRIGARTHWQGPSTRDRGGLTTRQRRMQDPGLPHPGMRPVGVSSVPRAGLFSEARVSG